MGRDVGYIECLLSISLSIICQLFNNIVLQLYRRTAGQTDGRIARQVDSQTDRQTDERTYMYTDEWTRIRTVLPPQTLFEPKYKNTAYVCMYIYIYISRIFHVQKTIACVPQFEESVNVQDSFIYIALYVCIGVCIDIYFRAAQRNPNKIIDAIHTLSSLRHSPEKNLLPVNHRQQVSADGILTIHNVSKDHDQGQYSCDARNSEGQGMSRHFHISVMGK